MIAHSRDRAGCHAVGSLIGRAKDSVDMVDIPKRSTMVVVSLCPEYRWVVPAAHIEPLGLV